MGREEATKLWKQIVLPTKVSSPVVTPLVNATQSNPPINTSNDKSSSVDKWSFSWDSFVGANSVSGELVKIWKSSSLLVGAPCPNVIMVESVSFVGAGSFLQLGGRRNRVILNRVQWQQIFIMSQLSCARRGMGPETPELTQTYGSTSTRPYMNPTLPIGIRRMIESAVVTM